MTIITSPIITNGEQDIHGLHRMMILTCVDLPLQVLIRKARWRFSAAVIAMALRNVCPVAAQDPR
jgi:hypothetical protein